MKKIITLLLGTFAAISLSSCSTAAAGAQGAAGGENMWVIVLVYAAILGAVYFFLIRPNSKKKKEEQALRDNVEVGDDITTIGGIVGRVVSIKEDTDSMIIETGADRTKMHIKKWAISTVDNEKAKAVTTDKADKKAKDMPWEKK